jgi:hypothetical protein
MDWSVTLERYGWKSDQVGSEPFSPLSAQVAQARAAGYATSKVSVTAGTSHDYGSLKVSVTVTVECPQTEAAINLAGEASFWKAVELVNDAASFIEAPPLQVKHGRPG